MIRVVQTLLDGHAQRWVLFEHGTCLILDGHSGDGAREPASLAAEAKDVLARVGPVPAEMPAGDCQAVRLRDSLGWVVSYDTEGLINYVRRTEAAAERDSSPAIGRLGCVKRDRDARSLNVVHVHDGCGCRADRT